MVMLELRTAFTMGLPSQKLLLILFSNLILKIFRRFFMFVLYVPAENAPEKSVRHMLELQAAFYVDRSYRRALHIPLQHFALSMASIFEFEYIE